VAVPSDFAFVGAMTAAARTLGTLPRFLQPSQAALLRQSEDCTQRRDLQGSDTAAVQDEQTITVGASQQTGV
jgi:hypothetical protein